MCGEPYSWSMEVVVGNLVAGGDAIARLPSGKVVFVDGALQKRESLPSPWFALVVSN